MRRQQVFTSPTYTNFKLLSSILYLCLNTFFKLVFYAVIKYSLKKVYIFVFEITFLPEYLYLCLQ